MIVPSEACARARGTRHVRAPTPTTTASTTISAILLLWVILIFTQISFCLAAHEESGKFIRSPPRKDRFSQTPLFHAPSTSSSSSTTPGQAGAATINGDSDTVYGDEKRIIHTGPNPLHN
ncbi:CLAVATA3/ESR (CLE)-related protein 16 [Quercus suber]|uniref:Clavata3/esr (Cle)-related protein 16 n=1 Tax=Quercus suber TaxID=58331 RepID=A0AAW0JQG6_QUESU|nr:CLAVATA3/ESR (CLE)-related protein 16-like [Quercus suber]POE64300.1 clavata3/esr (cle)-related protein 16 [Quercus suber]POE88939.1 clavata3/esr (cle)-related protein 16 [Quercus suber]